MNARQNGIGASTLHGVLQLFALQMTALTPKALRLASAVDLDGKKYIGVISLYHNTTINTYQCNISSQTFFFFGTGTTKNTYHSNLSSLTVFGIGDGSDSSTILSVLN